MKLTDVEKLILLLQADILAKVGADKASVSPATVRQAVHGEKRAMENLEELLMAKK